ncbi:hypothetical protein ACFYRY_42880 [Streptomyces sp. NPDC005263]|uniref:hypothetical protein n=1 Tax=Streptomyces sp. NPDC005263 TaxID=3364711 RepID=UPI0036C89D0E
MTAEAESTISVVPRARKKGPGPDKPSQPKDQDEASKAGLRTENDDPDEGLRPTA